MAEAQTNAEMAGLPVASALLGAGQDVATVPGILGHSSPAVTLRVYSHALPSRMREAADAVDTLYG